MNFLNPFVQRFAFSRFVPAALAGISIPILASLFAPVAAARAAASLGSSTAFLSNIIVLGSYSLAGALIGYFLDKNSFLWSFILTYLAVGAIVGFHPNPLPYGTIAALIAHAVGQRSKSSRLILQPTAVPKRPLTSSAAAK